MSTDKDANSQFPFLNDLRKRRQWVVIYLANGVKQTGVIDSFDRHAITLRQGETTVLIYKHTIASVMQAAKPLRASAFREPVVAQPVPAERRPAPVIVRKVSRRTY